MKKSLKRTARPERSRRVLAVGAHPDDIDFGASGTIARWASEGADVYYVICTDGSRGSEDPSMTYGKLAKVRQAEQRSAAKILGVKDVFFLKRVDTQLLVDFSLKQDIARIIRKVSPNIIITMDPTFYYSEKYGFINHTDHRAAAVATMDAFFPMARDRMTFPELEKEGLMPHITEEIWFIDFDGKGTEIVDISKTMDKKLSAIAAHKSQYKDFSQIEKRMRERARGNGKKKGYKYAETFKRVKLGW